MKITFLEDHMSLLSGNSFYKAGSQADLRRGQQLVDQGIAREGWEPLVEAEVSTFEYMSDQELRDLAKERDISVTWNMKRETLIERLSE